MHNNHMHNLVAKILRESFPETPVGEGRIITEAERNMILEQRASVTRIALAFAYRFNEEEGFDPLTFLDRCSPDTLIYPLSELWEEV